MIARNVAAVRGLSEDAKERIRVATSSGLFCPPDARVTRRITVRVLMPVHMRRSARRLLENGVSQGVLCVSRSGPWLTSNKPADHSPGLPALHARCPRSEERRVGKERERQSE